MSYQPTEPASIENVDQLRNYLRDELRAIAREMSEFDVVELRISNKAPIRPRDGMIVAADGTNFNPGGGAGIYARISGAWVKL